MAITVVHSSSVIEGLSSASVTTSPTFTSTSTNLLVAGATAWANASTAEGATPWADGGTNTWTDSHSGTVSSGGGLIMGAFGYAKNITGKAGEAVTFTINSANFPSAALIEASGCDTTAPNDVAGSWTTGTGTTLNSSLITPAAGDHLVVVVAGYASTAVQTVTNNGTGAATWTTIKNDSSSGEPTLLAYTIVTADGTSTYGVTYHNGGSSDGNVVGIIAFKAAAGGGGTAQYFPFMSLLGVG